MEGKFASDKAKCDCGNQCESLIYETRLAKLNHWHSQIQMIVESLKFYPLTRQKAFGVSEFLGSIGGLMGLFAGISIISLIESIFDFSTAMKARILKVKKRPKQILVIPWKDIMDETNEVKKKMKINRDHVSFECSEYFLRLAESSNVHGVNHIVNKKKRSVERIFWILVTLISIGFCMNTVFETMEHSKLSPIEFGIDNEIWSLNDVISESSFIILENLTIFSRFHSPRSAFVPI